MPSTLLPSPKHLRTLLLTGALFLPSLALAQATSPPLDPGAFTFEVISIHEDLPGSCCGASVDFTTARYTASGIPIRELLHEAYRVGDLQIDNLPDWANANSFTINAVTSPETQQALAALTPAGREAGERPLGAQVAPRSATAVGTHRAALREPRTRTLHSA